MWLKIGLVVVGLIAIYFWVQNTRYLHERARDVILKILRDKRPNGQFGLEIVKASKGIVKRSNVYICLSELEDEGYVHSWPQNTVVDPKLSERRLYQITEGGLGYLVGW